jgi:hypothetical protein
VKLKIKDGQNGNIKLTIVYFFGFVEVAFVISSIFLKWNASDCVYSILCIKTSVCYLPSHLEVLMKFCFSLCIVTKYDLCHGVPLSETPAPF